MCRGPGSRSSDPSLRRDGSAPWRPFQADNAPAARPQLTGSKRGAGEEPSPADAAQVCAAHHGGILIFETDLTVVICGSCHAGNVDVNGGGCIDQDDHGGFKLE